MEKQLREHLMEDEELLWSGCPVPFDTLDRTNKSSIIAWLVVKVAVALGFLVPYCASAQDLESIKPGVIIFVLAFAAFAVANPFLIARRLRGKTIYGLTNKRVMRSGANDQAVPYERIRHAALRTDEDGHTTLLCGPRAMKLKPRQWRGEADASFINSYDESEADRVILYALPMDDALREVLNQYLPLN